MKPFDPASQELFFSKQDPLDVRLGDLAKKNLESDNAAIFLGGYADDEGIRLNGGRVGAAEAPDRIRKYFYRMTPHVFQKGFSEIKDCGNLRLEGTLADRHETARKFVAGLLSKEKRWIGLGGGHDYAYADGAAYIDECRRLKVRPLVINFDAHLDVRPVDKGINSGTPFRRLLDLEPETELLQIGIQPQCNSASHLEWCLSKGAKVLSYEEIYEGADSPIVHLSKFLSESWLRSRPAFVSVDIDAFSSAYAPGCSQSWATGLEPRDFFPIFRVLCERLAVRVLGIYEVSPPLDTDDRTSKLAAQILHAYCG